MTTTPVISGGVAEEQKTTKSGSVEGVGGGAVRHRAVQDHTQDGVGIKKNMKLKPPFTPLPCRCFMNRIGQKFLSCA